ncbi:helix-turn-helix domain-containing protein [uncultured Oscillibacter sp.]|uniref:helix-turn-helix domain-containing protein n=1 Tax=uncultured Oscillibacter sp. TaxID=876091 RepID=UPI00272DED2D|nr:helix-turn-helix transcriptional regulator [uncultured Oscillibacter sp.]
MAKFKEILAELRKDRGLSQKELANAFHVSGSTISSYETGVHSPDIDQIIQFADFF